MRTATIDLSALTASEIAQFNANPEVTISGDTNVVLYLRYSSDRQTEQSIEGQLRDAIAFCKQNAYRICGVYVDRATSAAKDTEKRTEFLRMIADSDKGRFSCVLVWKLDRFSRSRSDSAIYKMRLRKNGVRVVSVTENISENPEGIILEALLEGMAEFHSAELSQKVTRGRRESALKCQSVGGQIPLGYKIENLKYVIDPPSAEIVRLAFDLYASGWTISDISREFKRRGYKTSKGADFNNNSFTVMFKNKRYIGVYSYKGTETEGGVPAIIDKETFDAVQRRRDQNRKAPGRGKAKVNYLLSGKLFCGHCGSPMNGDCGTGKSGKSYHYYYCHGKKRKNGCDKKPLRKEDIETWVVQDALELLTPETISEIADIAVSQSESDILKTTKLPALQQKRAEITKSISNIVVAIEKGIASDALMARITELELEQKQIDKQIAEEERNTFRLDRDMVIFWLEQFKNGDIEDETFKRQLIDLLVNRVVVWDTPGGDFKVEVSYNLTEHPSTTTSRSTGLKGSVLSDNGPPYDANPNFLVIGTLCVQTKIHSLP